MSEDSNRPAARPAAQRRSAADGPAPAHKSAHGQGGKVRPYNLFVQDRLTRARMPTLEVINDRFSRNLRAALFQHLRKTIEMSAGSVELLKHSQLLERLEVPSYLALVSLRPLRGTMLVVVDAQLVVSIVESRFGGNGRFPVTMGNREFTAVEQKVMRRVVETALEQFALAWQPVRRFEPEIIRQEFNPQFASVATSSEIVIVSTFLVNVDHGSGRLMICIPYTTLEPIRDQLMSGVVSDTVDTDGRWSDLLKVGVEQAMMPLRVELAEIAMTVGELLSLQVGDVFEIDRPETVVVEANGTPLWRGRWGRRGRKVAVEIEERVSVPPEVMPAAWYRGEDDGRTEQ